MPSFVLSKLGTDNIEEISAANNEPSWLKDYRKNSFSIYQELPPEVSPLYNKYSDATRMNSEEVTFSLISDSTVPDFVKDRMAELTDNHSVIQIATNINKQKLS